MSDSTPVHDGYKKVGRRSSSAVAAQFMDLIDKVKQGSSEEEILAAKMQLINKSVDDKLTGTETAIEGLKKRVKALEDEVSSLKGTVASQQRSIKSVEARPQHASSGGGSAMDEFM